MNRRLILTALVGAALTGACAGAPAPTPQVIYAPQPTPQVITLPAPSPVIVYQTPPVCRTALTEMNALLQAENTLLGDIANNASTKVIDADIAALPDTATINKAFADAATCQQNEGPQA